MNRRQIAYFMAALALALMALVLLPDAAAGDDDLSGRWVVVQRTTTVAKVPIVGKIYAVTDVVTLHDLAHDDGRLEGPGQLCHIEIDSGTSFFDVILPEAFKRALDIPVFEATISGSGSKRRLRQAKRTVVVGAKLDNPDDPLPTKASDKRVFDQDGDGKPGVTVRIQGIVDGDVHVAQRSWTTLSGKLVGTSGFNGGIRFDNEQVILGTTSSMLDDPPTTQPVPQKSWFRMSRLHPKADCEAARSVAKLWL